ncbi:Condensation domain [Macleaya cordata]|uniref:Condensation domain n=1 Tax=Macleaya cordata TaxID=56857 RepID=A0A200QHQ4_MACCD|nr:Condensation domain [Macleaya cordata]
MADLNVNPEELEPKSRPVGGTEYGWCRAVPGGTGITVLALLFSKSPDTAILEKALHKLQISHPILRSKLTSSNNTFSFLIPPIPHLQIQSFDLSSTYDLLQNLPNSNPTSESPFHRLLEYELNQNLWSESESDSENFENDLDLFCATLYSLEESKWVLAFRLHTSICDRTSAVTLLSELLELVGENEEGVKLELKNEDEVNLGIEDLIPSGKADKPFWSRGKDLFGYSLNSFRFSNLDFEDVISKPRSSGVVRLQMSPNETERLLAGCQARGIKLCGAIAAAGIIAAYSMKELPDYQWEKYAVVTLVDCRKFLDPPLESHHLGFYHSAILNTHDIKGGAELWELATRSYMALTNAMNSNKHFSDMSDLNFLMCKAIDNPSLTSSSSMRTSFMAVFEDPVFKNTNELHQKIGLEDYVGCSSVHGVGPSIAVFDTIRNDGLDLACVYPMPLHSREQMQKLIDHMKRTLIDGCD